MTLIQLMLADLNSRMTQEKIGAEVGLSQAAVSRLIRGVSQNTTYQQGSKIKALHQKHFPQNIQDIKEAAGKIEDLKRSLVVSQGNFEESMRHIEYLNKKINGMLGRRCMLCRVKAFFTRG